MIKYALFICSTASAWHPWSHCCSHKKTCHGSERGFTENSVTADYLIVQTKTKQHEKAQETRVWMMSKAGGIGLSAVKYAFSQCRQPWISRDAVTTSQRSWRCWKTWLQQKKKTITRKVYPNFKMSIFPTLF